MNQRQKLTIRDIARHAGVSISTVSRVLNDNASVADDKRQAVLAAIEELDYQPNIFAQGLASGQSRTIGVVTQFISSPYFSTVTRGVMLQLTSSGYSALFVDGSFDQRTEQESVKNLLSRK